VLDYAVIYILLPTVTFSSRKHSECIIVCALQKWLGERTTMLRYKYIAYLVNVESFVKIWLKVSIFSHIYP